MRKLVRASIGLVGVTALVLPVGGAAANPATFQATRAGSTLSPSGSVDFRDVNFGNGVTECPQAGRIDEQPRPLDRRSPDTVERLSNGGDDRRANQDFSCFPQDEMSISTNPRNPQNLVGGANDYRLGWGTSGFYASTDGGQHWYDGIIPFPSLPSGDNLDGGGDPAIVHDRNGVVYYADINFNRTDDTNGVFVSRSTNGGFTWSRPCVPIDTSGKPKDDQAVCGGTGDPRLPGDGVIAFLQDENSVVDGSNDFNDKEYISAGPRPAGVKPQCFGPESKRAVRCNPATIGVDRIYVTFTIFQATGSPIFVSYSDDQARSWSPPKRISGNAPFCVGSPRNECAFNQGSTPTVHKETGYLYVSWLNGNTPDEDQYLLARSKDGGRTFEGPFRVATIFDVNYPRAGLTRPDCALRGQSTGRAVLSNSCFRVNSYGAVTVDRRGGQYADDLYVVTSDNRNGTIRDSNVDVFLYKSTDGGSSWYGPTRVNDDASPTPRNFDRDCGRDPNNITGDPAKCKVRPSGNDQWFPWVDINATGDVNVVFQDRRTDRDSMKSEWPTSRTMKGNYLSMFWGGICRVSAADSRDCVAKEATRYTGSPSGPVDPGRDPVPGQHQSTFPFKNFSISDNPYNLDYSFRAGIFMGDYENVSVFDGQATAMWTDSRNGRSSKDQIGRNPICEQSDAFVDSYDAVRGTGTRATASASDEKFLVTPCPADATDPGNRGRR